MLPERDEELLRLLASEAAITIHRTDLVAKLQSTARTDPLTGLPNRRVWDEDLERELARARRHGGSLCLAMLDLDRFKAFNDHHGHQAGDQLLAATAWPGARRCARRTRSPATAARSSPCCSRTPTRRARCWSSSACSTACRSARPPPPASPPGTARESAQELLARADAALYDAKRAGRARALFSPSAL